MMQTASPLAHLVNVTLHGVTVPPPAKPKARPSVKRTAHDGTAFQRKVRARNKQILVQSVALSIAAIAELHDLSPKHVRRIVARERARAHTTKEKAA